MSADVLLPRLFIYGTKVPCSDKSACLLEALNLATSLSYAIPASRHGWGLLFDTPTRGRRACYAVTGRAQPWFSKQQLFLLEPLNLATSLSYALRFGALEAELEAVAIHTNADGTEAGFIHLVAGAGG